MAARFKCNGTDEASIANPLEPDTGSGYRLIPSGTGITYETSQFYEGTSSIVGNDSDYLYLGDGSGGYIGAASSFYVDFFWRCSSLPGSDTMIFGSTYIGDYGAYVTSTGRLRFKAAGTTSGESATSLLTANTWYRLRFKHDATNGLIEAYVWTANFTQDDPVSASATQVLPTTSLAGLYVLFGLPTASTFFYDDIVAQPVSEGNPTHSSSTTHTASATPSFTANRTAAATLTAVVGATRSTTATTTAAAAVERAAAASLASTATTTAAATVEKVAAASLTVTASTSASPVGEVAGDASLAVTATLTASADVSTPGVVSIAASLPVTATPAVVAVLERVAAATAATTATVTAAADVSTPGSHSADASVSVTATLTAAASVNRNAAASLAVTSSITVAGALDEETTRGLMAGIERAASTMTPITGAGSPPRRVSLLSFDVATMTALVSMTQVPGLAGVPVFIGGDSSPEAAGLVDAGTAYLWISDGVVYYEDGS